MWKDNANMDLKKTVNCSDGRWIQLAHVLDLVLSFGIRGVRISYRRLT